MASKKIGLNNKVFLVLVLVLPLLFSSIILLLTYKSYVTQNELINKQVLAVNKSKLQSRLSEIDVIIKSLTQHEILKNFINLPQEQRFIVEGRVFSLLEVYSNESKYIKSISLKAPKRSSNFNYYILDTPIYFNDHGVNVINYNNAQNYIYTVIDIDKLKLEIKDVKNLSLKKDKDSWVIDFEVSKTMDPEFWVLFIVIMLFSLSSTFFGILLFRKNIIIPLNDLYESLKRKYKNNDFDEYKDNEIENLKVIFENYDQEIKSAQSKILDQQKKLVFINTARQVAHDIRSPLSAMKMSIPELNNLEENTRIILKKSISRIEDIANNLLERSRKKKDSNKKIHLISALSEIITQKRVEKKNNSYIDLVNEYSNNSYSTFIEIDRTKLTTVISNIINNSYESIEHNGKILVKTTAQDSDVKIVVSDNGKGIDKKYIKDLGKEGFTIEKQNGNGLGLFNAIQIISKAGGTLNIKSEINIGTEVEISLPFQTPPEWFSTNINLKNKIVVLDDDEGMQQTWLKRLADKSINKDDINIYSSASKLLNASKEFLDTTFLLDYEIINEKKTGLDIINNINSNCNAYLITSYYDDIDLQEKVMELNSKIIPKPFSNIVPLVRSLLDPHIVLIDDDEIIRRSWERKAVQENIKISTFDNIHNFINNHFDISKEANIYIDSNLKDSVKGEIESEKIFKLGYKNIYITTGYASESIQKPNWVIKIVSKSFPQLDYYIGDKS